jgi:group II intron reverse transcriptase/maturase
MGDVVQELEHLAKLAKENPQKRFNRLYRLLRQPAFLMLAKAKVRGNRGANTPGVDGQVMAEVTPADIIKLSEQLADGTYQSQPVRRTYIPKKGSNKQRPLGIPTCQDKVVQTGVALILEALYEPLFRNCSHGFRPGRSPITALRQLSTAYRAGATWVIEGDLANCFGSIPHHVILNCLRKRICDEHFIDLVRRILQAGVMEGGKLTHTYSGTPQGGTASPILANVVLHELDRWMETHLGANPPAQTPKQQWERSHPEYMRLTYRIRSLRGYLDGKRSIPKGRSEMEIRQELREKLAERRQTPRLLPRRVIYYSRYADDFLVVLCYMRKQETEELKEQIAHWLHETLGLTLNEQKTLITHWRERLHFLGYQLEGRQNITGSHWLHLSVPMEAMRGVVAKVKQATAYPQAPEYDVFVNVNTIARGWTNYYRFAHNIAKVAGRLGNVIFWCTLHYLGKKHHQSIRRVMKHHRSRDPKTGCKALYVQKSGMSPIPLNRYFLWPKRPKRLSLASAEAAMTKDTKPLPKTSWATGHSIAQRRRVHAAATNRCQNCGCSNGTMYVHHPNRLRNVRRARKGYGHVARSGYAQQGKLLCQACHLEHHHGYTSQ